ncbi:MAG: hypothetical protein DYG89_06280 [Caldilinea sp. CFX5]|nr:hypothetical protein [Caldilinea sp. CFX5]
MSLKEQLIEFAEKEKEFYASKDAELFDVSIAQVIQYYDFLTILLSNYDNYASNFTSLQIMFRNTIGYDEEDSRNPYGISRKEMNKHSQECGQQLTLLIESFYLFAKLTLDKIALFIQLYFGQAKGLSLISHTQLYKNFGRYIQLKDLKEGELFLDLAGFFDRIITQYRDKQIIHLQNLRVSKGIVHDWSRSLNNARLITIPKLNTDNREIAESEILPNLMDQINKYLIHFMYLIELNRSKSKFSLRV